ncbi:MAG TPA: glycine zipper 2TM domain-containing protein, partial [Xanthomonadaceae bacterium]|nr:glycine zipper 2TM domain-containing protein [Xanthomonadaceae bacterium]
YTESNSYAGGYGDYRNDGYRNDGYGNGYYRNDGSYNGGSSTARNVATIVGGVLGAAIGSQVGGGSARYATSAIGSMVGGMAGRQVYDSAHRPTRVATVQVCDPVNAGQAGYYGGNTYSGSGYGGNGYDASGVDGYDVTYEYAGRTYVTRSRYNPGNRIRVRVDVHPE